MTLSIWNAAFRRGATHNPKRLIRLCSTLCLSVLAGGFAIAQSSATAPNETQDAASNQPELTTREDLQTFQVKVNLVELRVVVRDAQGNAVGNLKQDDFRLFDDNKPQSISRFSVEHHNVNKPAINGTKNAPEPETPPDGPLSSNHVAYLFDDVNATANDLVGARDAVEKRINSLQAGELAAIFTISGQGQQDLTSDQEKLRAALRNLKPRPVNGFSASECPPIDYYIASQIGTYHDGQAFTMVEQEVLGCQFDGDQRTPISTLEAATRNAVDRVLQSGEAQNQLILHSVGDVVRRMSALPGQRTIVFLSEGFFIAEQQAAVTDYLNRAIRAGVIINTLDVRGLYTQPANGVDISQKAWGASRFAPEMLRYTAQADLEKSDTLMQIANATGGNYFRNNNDLGAGVVKLSAAPEYTYLLAFAPQGLKNDGKFHSLKVELKQSAGLSLQARKGYYAPVQGDTRQEVQREIADEVFAQDELHELPLRVQTQFFRSATDSVQIAVLVHVDVQHMAFQKTAGRNLNELTIVAAIFDRNANFISAKSKTVQMHIKDETLTKMNSGITLKSNFDVNPGSYVIRVVARDGQGKLAAQNDVIEIP